MSGGVSEEVKRKGRWHHRQQTATSHPVPSTQDWDLARMQIALNVWLRLLSMAVYVLSMIWHNAVRCLDVCDRNTDDILDSDTASIMSCQITRQEQHSN